jgi:hypothetical protein
MTNKQKAASLIRLNKALARTRNEYNTALGALLSKIQEFHPDDIIVGNDFPGDGLGIAIGEHETTYMGVNVAIAIIRERGQISKDDPTYL